MTCDFDGPRAVVYVRGVRAMGLAWVWACGCAGVGVGVGVRSWFWLGIWLIDGGFGRVSGGISLIGGGSVWAIGR